MKGKGKEAAGSPCHTSLLYLFTLLIFIAIFFIIYRFRIGNERRIWKCQVISLLITFLVYWLLLASSFLLTVIGEALGKRRGTKE